MMYKLLLCSLLVVGVVTVTTAQPIIELMENKKNNEIKSVVLKDLNFKTVMKTFYQKDLQYVKISELDQKNLQYVGIKNLGNIHEGKESGILIFSAAKPYQNKANESRYVLTVSQFAISEHNSQHIEMGKFAFSVTIIYIFKKNEHGQYQLVSHNENNCLLNDDFLYVPYPTDQIIKNIRNIGSKIKGYVEEQEYSQNGYSSTKLRIIPFDEQTDLISLDVAEIGNDNEATGNEETYNTHGDYHFLTSEHDGLYDIEIRYSGTKQIYVDDIAKIVPVNEAYIYHYNEKQQKYIRVK